MKSYIKAIGNSIILWIIGFCPVIFPVIYSIIDEDGIYADIVMSISLFLGGLLCIFVMKKEHHVGIKEYFNKPDIKTIILVISTSLFYVMTALYILYLPTLTGEPDADTIKIISLVLASTIVPVGEELIFRFAMLTLLFIASKDSSVKKVFSIIVISFAWMVMHFHGDAPRIFDLMIIGVIIGFLYLKSKNILYCIIFHFVANTCTYSFVAVYHWFSKREYILYISTVLFLISLILLFYNLCKEKHLKFDV